MGFFQSLFGKNKSAENPLGLPENANLLALISKWYAKPNDDTYKNVVLELRDGKPTLLLPSKNDLPATGEWQTATEDTTLNLTCIYEVDGLKVLGAFTDEEALLNWAKTPVSYTAMKSNDVMVLCENNSISRMVINSDNYNMFVLSRNRKTSKPYSLKANSKIMVGPPARPLPASIIEKIRQGFGRQQQVLRAFQYLQIADEVQSIVIGIQLSGKSDDAKAAAIFAVEDAIRGENLEQPVDIIFLETEEWLNTVAKIDNALFYKPG